MATSVSKSQTLRFCAYLAGPGTLLGLDQHWCKGAGEPGACSLQPQRREQSGREAGGEDRSRPFSSSFPPRRLCRKDAHSLF